MDDHDRARLYEWAVTRPPEWYAARPIPPGLVRAIAKAPLLREEEIPAWIDGRAWRLPGKRGSLTVRQRQVLSALSLGWSKSKIAREIGVSVYTVQRTVQLLLRRYGTATSAATVAAAIREHHID